MESQSSGLVAEAKKKLQHVQRQGSFTCKLKTKVVVPVVKTTHKPGVIKTTHRTDVKLKSVELSALTLSSEEKTIARSNISSVERTVTSASPDSATGRSVVSSLVSQFVEKDNVNSLQNDKQWSSVSPTKPQGRPDFKSSKSLTEPESPESASGSSRNSTDTSSKRWSLSSSMVQEKTKLFGAGRSPSTDSANSQNKLVNENVTPKYLKTVPQVFNSKVAGKISQFDQRSADSQAIPRIRKSPPKSITDAKGSARIETPSPEAQHVSRVLTPDVVISTESSSERASSPVSVYKTEALHVIGDPANQGINMIKDQKIKENETLSPGVVLRPKSPGPPVKSKPKLTKTDKNLKQTDAFPRDNVTDTRDRIAIQLSHQENVFSKQVTTDRNHNLPVSPKSHRKLDILADSQVKKLGCELADKIKLPLSIQSSSKTRDEQSSDSDDYDDIVYPGEEKSKNHIQSDLFTVKGTSNESSATINDEFTSSLSTSEQSDSRGPADVAETSSEDSWEDCDSQTSPVPQIKLPTRSKRRKGKRHLVTVPLHHNARSTSPQPPPTLPPPPVPNPGERESADSSDNSYEDIDSSFHDYLEPLPSVTLDAAEDTSNSTENVQLPTVKRREKSPGILKSLHNKLLSRSRENVTEDGSGKIVTKTQSDPMAGRHLHLPASGKMKPSHSAGDVREQVVIGPPVPHRKFPVQEEDSGSVPPPLPPRLPPKQTNVTMDMVVPLPLEQPLRPSRGNNMRGAKSMGNLDSRLLVDAMTDSYLSNPMTAESTSHWRSCAELKADNPEMTRPQKAKSMADGLQNVPPPPPRNQRSKGQGYVSPSQEGYLAMSDKPKHVYRNTEYIERGDVENSTARDEYLPMDDMDQSNFATFPRSRGNRSRQKAEDKKQPFNQGYLSMDSVVGCGANSSEQEYFAMDGEDNQRPTSLNIGGSTAIRKSKEGYFSMDSMDQSSTYSSTYISAEDIASYPMRKSTPAPFADMWSPTRESAIDSSCAANTASYISLRSELDETNPVEKRIVRQSAITRKRFASRFFDDQPLYQVYHRRDQVLDADGENSVTVTVPGDDDSADISVFEEDVSPAVESTQLQVPSTSVSNLRRMSNSKMGMRTLWSEMPEVKDNGYLDNISGNDRKIQEATFELITSEASYLQSLNILIDQFVNAPEFSEEGENDTICLVDKTSRDKHFLFSNVIAVRDVSESLLEILEDKWNESVLLKPAEIVNIIHEHAVNHFDAYVTYCRNQVYQLRTLDKLRKMPEFTSTLRRLEQTPECQGLTMQSFLLLPMQRITRLPLLIDAVYHRMDPQDVTVHSVHNALQLLNKIVKRCNEEAKQMETIELISQIDSKLQFGNLKRFPMISQSRYIVKQGMVTNITCAQFKKTLFRKKPIKQKLQLFLFNDILLVTEKKTSHNLGISEEKLIVLDYAPRIAIHIELIDEEDPEDVAKWLPLGVPAGCKNIMAMTLLENHQQKQSFFVIASESVSERQRWVDAMTPAEQDNPHERIYEDWESSV